MAYYYAGSTYIDLNNYPEALKYFQTVIDVAGTDNPLTYKAYSQMGSIFLYQDLYDKGIEAFIKACNYNEKVGNKDNLIYEFCGIADCFKMKKDETAALQYLNKALALSGEVGNKMMRFSILGQMANLYYKQKDFVAALNYIRQALNGVDKANMRSIYSIAADIYKDTGNGDSVLFLCDALYKMDDIYAQHFASKNLAHHFLEKHNAPKALFYIRQYEALSDSIKTITQTQAIAKVNALYNYQIKEKEIATLNAEIKERRYAIFIISIITVSIISLLILYVLILKKKRHIESIKSERIKEKLKDMNKMMEIKIANREIAEEGIGASEIYNKIWTIYRSKNPGHKKKISREDWNTLDFEVNKYFPNFKDFLLETCEITMYEYKICLLIKITPVRDKKNSIKSW